MVSSRKPHYCKLSFADPNFLASEAQTMSIGNRMRHGKWTAHPFAVRATSPLIHKEQQSMAETLCLVSWCAGIHSRPTIGQRSTRGKKKKEGCCFPSQLVHKSVHRETASHPCVTLVWYLYLFVIHQGRVFLFLSRGDDGPVLFSVPAALVMRSKV
jgi:hypothetical protein